MASHGPLEQFLEDATRYLSLVLDAFEGLVSEFANRLWASVKRTGRFVLRMLRQGLISLSYLLRLFSIFLALVWFGSGCHYVSYYESSILKVVGWAGTIFIAL